ncbi:MAG: hypothetical protein H7240_07205 [Glaciimonas sp.]|nr:hypothetical protein [Glaciimonas sp.]
MARAPAHIEGLEVLASGFTEISRQPGYESLISDIFYQIRTTVNQGIDITLIAPKKISV